MAFYCHRRITKQIILKEDKPSKDHKAIESKVNKTFTCNTKLTPHGDNYYWCQTVYGGCGLMWTKKVIEGLNRQSPDDPIEFSKLK